MSRNARESDAAYRPLRIADLPRGLQPREQLKSVGAANVADDVLVAIILRIGVPGLELGRRASYQELAKVQDADVRIDSTQDVAALLLPLVYGSMQERFFVVLLGPRNKVLGRPREIAKGQRDAVGLATNLVFEQPMKEGARAVVVAHNHPSGDPEPSEEDVELTKKLIAAGRLLNIPVLDHVILGIPNEEHAGFFSMAASGMVDF